MKWYIYHPGNQTFLREKGVINGMRTRSLREAATFCHAEAAIIRCFPDEIVVDEAEAEIRSVMES